MSRDIAQIALIAFYTNYSYCKVNCDETHTVTCGKSKRISEKKALEVLGREQFLHGLCRSAFHWTATCENGKREIVSFDSRGYFK